MTRGSTHNTSSHTYTIFLQIISCRPLVLKLWVIVVLPLGKLVTCETFMRYLPLNDRTISHRLLACKTHLLLAGRTCDLVLTSCIDKDTLTLNPMILLGEKGLSLTLSLAHQQALGSLERWWSISFKLHNSYTSWVQKFPI